MCWSLNDTTEETGNHSGPQVWHQMIQIELKICWAWINVVFLKAVRPGFSVSHDIMFLSQMSRSGAFLDDHVFVFVYCSMAWIGSWGRRRVLLYWREPLIPASLPWWLTWWSCCQPSALWARRTRMLGFHLFCPQSFWAHKNWTVL